MLYKICLLFYVTSILYLGIYGSTGRVINVTLYLLVTLYHDVFIKYPPVAYRCSCRTYPIPNGTWSFFFCQTILAHNVLMSSNSALTCCIFVSQSTAAVFLGIPIHGGMYRPSLHHTVLVFARLVLDTAESYCSSRQNPLVNKHRTSCVKTCFRERLNKT